ncbi:MAG: hypothetical protein JWQ21_2851 [Herminiimonas sp.]|nr:hypothetical protein [Herminiimonas sp.]
MPFRLTRLYVLAAALRLIPHCPETSAEKHAGKSNMLPQRSADSAAHAIGRYGLK